MALLSWRDDYRIGVPSIDAEHRYLIGLINEFHDEHARGGGRHLTLRVLNKLVTYAEQHFRHEEALMQEIGYPRLSHQRDLHEGLYASIFALHEDLAVDAGSVNSKTLRFLRHWLLEHIVKEDMDIGDFLRRKAVQAARASRRGERGQAGAKTG